MNALHSRPITIADALNSLHDTIAFSVVDFSETRSLAWIYGVVIGWDAPAITELKAKFEWDDDAVERMKLMHESIEAASRFASQAQNESAPKDAK